MFAQQASVARARFPVVDARLQRAFIFSSTVLGPLCDRYESHFEPFRQARLAAGPAKVGTSAISRNTSMDQGDRVLLSLFSLAELWERLRSRLLEMIQVDGAASLGIMEVVR